MEAIPSPLQGGIGYLLIVEILIVAGLTWVLIGLVLKKIRYPQTQPETPEVENSEPYLALVKKLEELETEKQMLMVQASSNGEVEKLQKTVSFLENKLLGYEIVQEEISVLGELKAENEKLRNELSALKSPTLPSEVEENINKQFSEFSSETKPTPTSTENKMPGEIENLLSDIDKLAQTPSEPKS
jgi:polyhydroxyalkanoate synthesis regulator phasin